jgi:hypothetical protein
MQLRAGTLQRAACSSRVPVRRAPCLAPLRASKTEKAETKKKQEEFFDGPDDGSTPTTAGWQQHWIDGNSAVQQCWTMVLLLYVWLLLLLCYPPLLYYIDIQIKQQSTANVGAYSRLLGLPLNVLKLQLLILCTPARTCCLAETLHRLCTLTMCSAAVMHLSFYVGEL